jgi:hypothetical protein
MLIDLPPEPLGPCLIVDIVTWTHESFALTIVMRRQCVLLFDKSKTVEHSPCSVNLVVVIATDDAGLYKYLG